MDGYGWHPLDKKALGVVPFRGHMSRLCTRAGKTGWALRDKAIWNTFPDWLRRKVDVTPTEDTFWTNVTTAVNIAMMDQMDSSRTERADKNGDYNCDSKDCNSKDGDSHKDCDKHDRDRDNRKDKCTQCQFCRYLGHELGDCHKMKAAAVAQQQQQPTGQSRNN